MPEDFDESSREALHVNKRTGDPGCEWEEVGRWWSEIPLGRKSLARTVVGEILGLAGRVFSPHADRIVMFHTGRCGSSVLACMLNSREDIFWDAETLGRRANWFRAPNAYLGPRPAESARREIRRRFWRASGSRFGFEVKPRDLMTFGTHGQDEVEALMSDLGVRYRIGLVRRNVLRRVISSEKGGWTGRFHEKTGESVTDAGPFVMPVDGLKTYAGKPHSIEDALVEEEAAAAIVPAMAGPEALQLVYEDDVEADPRVAYEKIIEYLGLPMDSPEVPLRRTNPGSLDDIIVNADEVRERLRTTRWAWMTE